MSIELLLAVLAAFVGGAMNAISGGGTFVTYPALLLLLGNSGIVANTTSTIVLWPGLVASLGGYKKEIPRIKNWLRALALPSLVGGIIGSFILTHTPSDRFTLIAPILILTGALMLQFQTQINRFFQFIKLDSRKRAPLVLTLIFVFAIYGTYFGAGIGILLLGCVSLLGIKDLYENIALKNVLALTINFTAVIYFTLSGVVQWSVIPWLVLSSVLGGYMGSHFVHYIDKRVVKTFTVALGTIIAIILLVLRTN